MINRKKLCSAAYKIIKEGYSNNKRNCNDIKDFITIVSCYTQIRYEFLQIIRKTCVLKKLTLKNTPKKIERHKFGPKMHAMERARGGEPVEYQAHIVLIGNPDSRGVS